MLGSMRKMTQSKVGAAVALVFLGLIALAFASSDVAGTGSFGGVAGGSRVAMVGDEKIGTATLSQAASSALERVKEQNPQMSMAAFLAAGGLEQALEQLIDRTALVEFGRKHGIVAGDRLIDSEIAAIPAFKGPDGRFSDAAYRQAIQQRGLSDELVRADLSAGLVARQVLVPGAFGAVMPMGAVSQYATLLRERRKGAIALLPAAAFAPAGQPSDAELQKFYAANRSKYIRPERRVIRYVTYDDTVLKNLPAPTDAEIAAYYKANAATYSAVPMRTLTQLIVPTEAAARAILAEVRGGASLEAAARSKGLATVPIASTTKPALASQSAPAVADAAFGAAAGAIAGPARSGLGWHLVRVDRIEDRPARSIDQVRGEIVTTLTATKRRTALNAFSAAIEEELDEGGSLADVAKRLGAQIQQTPAVTADGQVYGQSGVAAPAELAPLLQTAFAMEDEGEAQLAEVEPGKRFVVFDVADIAPSAPAPLAEIRQDVATALRLSQGATAAKAAAERVAAAARKGTDMGQAVAALGKPLPPVDRIDLNRQQLAQQGQAVPQPMVLLFSMAERTVKLLPAPNDRGWYVVALADIEPGEVKADDPVLAAARKELGSLVGREYAEQLRRAIRAEVGVERNETAIRAVRTQLTGGN